MNLVARLFAFPIGGRNRSQVSGTRRINRRPISARLSRMPNPNHGRKIHSSSGSSSDQDARASALAGRSQIRHPTSCLKRTFTASASGPEAVPRARPLRACEAETEKYAASRCWIDILLCRPPPGTSAIRGAGQSWRPGSCRHQWLRRLTSLRSVAAPRTSPVRQAASR